MVSLCCWLGEWARERQRGAHKLQFGSFLLALALVLVLVLVVVVVVSCFACCQVIIRCVRFVVFLQNDPRPHFLPLHKRAKYEDFYQQNRKIHEIIVCEVHFHQI